MSETIISLKSSSGKSNSEKNNLATEFLQQVYGSIEDTVSWSSIKTSAEMQTLQAQPNTVKKQFILDAIDYYKATCFQENHYKGFMLTRSELWDIATVLIRKNLEYTQAEWCTLFTKLADVEDSVPEDTEPMHYSVGTFPMLQGIKQLENVLKKQPLHEETQQCIAGLLERDLFTEPPRNQWMKLDKILTRLKALLPAETVALFEPVDAGNSLNAYLNSLTPQADFHALFLLLLNSRASKPTKKWQKSLHELQETLGKTNCAAVGYHICDIVLTHNLKRIEQKLVSEWICDAHIDLLKGVVWSLENQQGKQSDDCLLRVLRAAYGQQKDAYLFSAKLGNACLAVLEKRVTLEIAHQLVMLNQEKHLDKKCKVRLQESITLCCEQLGKTADELGEMAVPDFNLTS